MKTTKIIKPPHGKLPMPRGMKIRVNDQSVKAIKSQMAKALRKYARGWEAKRKATKPNALKTTIETFYTVGGSWRFRVMDAISLEVIATSEPKASAVEADKAGQDLDDRLTHGAVVYRRKAAPRQPRHPAKDDMQ